MSENKGYAHPEALVDAEWVRAHLTDPTVRLIEVDVDTTAYEQGHLPGAVGFNRWLESRQRCGTWLFSAWMLFTRAASSWPLVARFLSKRR